MPDGFKRRGPRFSGAGAHRWRDTEGQQSERPGIHPDGLFGLAIGDRLECVCGASSERRHHASHPHITAPIATLSIDQRSRERLVTVANDGLAPACSRFRADTCQKP